MVGAVESLEHMPPSMPGLQTGKGHAEPLATGHCLFSPAKLLKHTTTIASDGDIHPVATVSIAGRPCASRHPGGAWDRPTSPSPHSNTPPTTSALCTLHSALELHIQLGTTQHAATPFFRRAVKVPPSCRHEKRSVLSHIRLRLESLEQHTVARAWSTNIAAHGFLPGRARR